VVNGPSSVAADHLILLCVAAVPGTLSEAFRERID
jgi:hypothetical protein